MSTTTDLVLLERLCPAKLTLSGRPPIDRRGFSDPVGGFSEEVRFLIDPKDISVAKRREFSWLGRVLSRLGLWGWRCPTCRGPLASIRVFLDGGLATSVCSFEQCTTCKSLFARTLI